MKLRGWWMKFKEAVGSVIRGQLEKAKFHRRRYSIGDRVCVNESGCAHLGGRTFKREERTSARLSGS